MWSFSKCCWMHQILLSFLISQSYLLSLWNLESISLSTRFLSQSDVFCICGSFVTEFRKKTDSSVFRQGFAEVQTQQYVSIEIQLCSYWHRFKRLKSFYSFLKCEWLWGKRMIWPAVEESKFFNLIQHDSTPKPQFSVMTKEWLFWKFSECKFYEWVV